MITEPGLRERKKQQTRRRIFETASRLFGEHGFDHVTVAQIARAAEVSEPTVFNYFPTKEDLFFGGLALFEEHLLDAVRDRAPGESVLSAFRRAVLDNCEVVVVAEQARHIARAARLIGASAALQARERETRAAYTERLASLLAGEQGAAPDDLEAAAVASALMGSQGALVAYLRARVQEGRHGPQLAGDARSHATRAFARLAEGLADYALRASEPAAPRAPSRTRTPRRSSHKRPS